ncbi:unnamed protein product [Durusdinium trenchii]|uniref:Trafficking protein particle complex subunit 8 n=1 Tax=Durusdinium trenchii TaxID=1381693 RepID=A0ABP0SV21_9DINO
MFEPRKYAEWLHSEVFQPVIVVIGTAQAKTRVKEVNGLSLAELFAPFGGHSQYGISVSVQSLERQITIDNLRVHFTDADAALQLSALQADQLAAWTVESSALENASRQKALEPPSPWYEQWRSALFRSLRWSDHEGLDQPTAAMLVVMSKEAEPAMLLEQLLHASNMPPLCTQGILDPVPSRVAVLLHDVSDPESPNEDELTQKLTDLKTRFAPNQVYVLQINRGSAEVEPEIEELFRNFSSNRHAPPPPPAPNEGAACAASPGSRLSSDDVKSVAQVVAEVVVRSAVPWMEKQLQQLEAQISQTRKGFRNQLKYLWRKPREANERGEVVQEDSGAYPLHSVEGQMRLAGDISFHLRDYEVALGYYRNVVSDFKQDRSWKHAAGAYEMWGLCTYITNGARSERNRCMESAYEHYLQASSSRLAMRAVVLHQAMVSDLKDAALRLMKVNGDLADSNLRNALILEQAGQLYYTCAAPRKGAFHLVLAGHTYNKLGFKRLALFSYQAVVDLYLGKGWFHISDHFHFTMARQANRLGLKDESLSHFLELLNSFADADKKIGIQAERENTYIEEFLYVIKDWVHKRCGEGETKTIDLQIPRIQPEVRVRLLDDVECSREAMSPKNGDEVAAAPWDALGEKMLGITTEDRLELNWRQRSDPRIFDTLRRVTTVGAEVVVEVTLTNPMRVKWEMAAVRLRGQLQSTDGVAEEVVFASQDVTLAPLESRTIKLMAVPQKEGLLQIQSVTWNLFDCRQVICDRPFQLKGRRLRNTLEQRASKSGVYSGDLRLELKVRSKKPRLSAQLQGLQLIELEGVTRVPRLLQGELHKCSLVISTETDCPLAFLHVAASYPGVALDAPEGYEGLEVDFREEGLRLHGTFPRELRVPVLVCINASGLHSVRLLVLAEALGDGPKSEQRQWITLEEQIRVEPALSMTARPSPSYAADGRILFSCHLENRAAEALQVQRVLCYSGSSGSSQLPFQASSQGGEIVIQPGQNAQLLYTLQWPCEQIPAAQSTRSRLLQANRAAHLALSAASKRSSRREKEPLQMAPPVDLVVQWRQGDRAGEACALQVPLERPEAPPCPLDLHLLAPEVAEMEADLMVPVTVRIRNASLAGSVSFYFVAESTADIAWIGCERSEIISLPPNTSHSATLHAYFAQPGVYNLNRFRLFVVGMPSGSVPASEQAPLAFAVPFERLLHVTAGAEKIRGSMKHVEHERRLDIL